MKLLMACLALLMMFSVATAGGFKGKSGGTPFVGPKGPQNGIKSPMVKQEIDKRFAPHKVGSKWTFKVLVCTPIGDLERDDWSVEVAKVDGSTSFNKSEAGQSKQEVGWGTDNGFYCWGPINDGKWKPVMALFKLGSKAGDTWDGWTANRAQNMPDVKITYVADEDLEVPAGKYKNVVHVKAEVKDGPTIHYYFAPEVGLVKISVFVEDEENKLVERSKVLLASFTEGK